MPKTLQPILAVDLRRNELRPSVQPNGCWIETLSSGKKPSAKRFQPRRASLTCAEFTIFTQDNDDQLYTWWV